MGQRARRRDRPHRGEAPALIGAQGLAHTPGHPAHRRSSRARAFLLALPILLIAAGLVYDRLTPVRFTALPLFAAAALIAAPFYSRRGTAAIGLCASLAVAATHITRTSDTVAEGLTDLVTSITVAALAVLINTVLRRSSTRLATAREIAEAAQRAVLPQPAPRIGGLDVAARYEAAQADAFIGGDLYAVQETPYGNRLLIGDVRGKGMGAVATVAVTIGAFREAAEQEAALEGVALRLDHALSREGGRRPGLEADEGFVTAVLVEVPPGLARLRILDRGHPEPLLLHPGGRVDALSPTEHALPLGLGALGDRPGAVQEVPFPPGALLLLYTDGVSEARDRHGVFYDPVTRLRNQVFRGPDALLTELAADVRRHTDHAATTDDMALLAVQRPAPHEE